MGGRESKSMSSDVELRGWFLVVEKSYFERRASGDMLFSISRSSSFAKESETYVHLQL